MKKIGRPKKAEERKYKRIAITIDPELLLKVTALLDKLGLCRTEYFITLIKSDLNNRGE